MALHAFYNFPNCVFLNCPLKTLNSYLGAIKTKYLYI